MRGVCPLSNITVASLKCTSGRNMKCAESVGLDMSFPQMHLLPKFDQNWLLHRKCLGRTYVRKNGNGFFCPSLPVRASEDKKAWYSMKWLLVSKLSKMQNNKEYKGSVYKSNRGYIYLQSWSVRVSAERTDLLRSSEIETHEKKLLWTGCKYTVPIARIVLHFDPACSRS